MADLHRIVRHVGHGEVFDGGHQAKLPAPGHGHRDRSLTLKLDGDRLLWFCHSTTHTHPQVMSYLGLELEERPLFDRAEQARRTQEREAQQRLREREALAFCEHVWTGAQPLAGSPAAVYLAVRGLNLSSCPDLRFHPLAPRCKPREPGDDRPAPPPHPALLALVRDVTGAPRGLHATYVKPDGSGKALGDRSRLMFGPVREGAVRLFPLGSDGQLAVGEGIETCASYAGLHGIPTWATLSTAGMQTFRVPGGVKRLVVAADGDPAGLEAAGILASRARCEASVDAAPLGSDWADVWEGRSRAA